MSYVHSARDPGYTGVAGGPQKKKKKKKKKKKDRGHHAAGDGDGGAMTSASFLFLGPVARFHPPLRCHAVACGVCALNLTVTVTLTTVLWRVACVLRHSVYSVLRVDWCVLSTVLCLQRDFRAARAVWRRGDLADRLGRSRLHQ